MKEADFHDHRIVESISVRPTFGTARQREIVRVVPSDKSQAELFWSRELAEWFFPANAAEGVRLSDDNSEGRRDTIVSLRNGTDISVQVTQFVSEKWNEHEAHRESFVARVLAELRHQGVRSERLCAINLLLKEQDPTLMKNGAKEIAGHTSAVLPMRDTQIFETKVGCMVIQTVEGNRVN